MKYIEKIGQYIFQCRNVIGGESIVACEFGRHTYRKSNVLMFLFIQRAEKRRIGKWVEVRLRFYILNMRTIRIRGRT